MDIAAIMALLQVVIQEAPGVFTTVESLVNLGIKFKASLDGQEPSQADQDALRTQIVADYAEAMKPLPLAQPGDPDYVKPAT